MLLDMLFDCCLNPVDLRVGHEIKDITSCFEFMPSCLAKFIRTQEISPETFCEAEDGWDFVVALAFIR